jgi:hypothetical protein
MAGLTEDQKNDLQEFLMRQGVTFPPLLWELSDHITCDIEERMKEGFSYEESRIHVLGELSNNHFISIQQETMETINRRFSVSRVFTYVGLSALFLATIFKTLHLQGTSALATIAFFSLAAALVTGSFLGIYLNRQKTGAIYILGVVAGVILMIAGYGFRIFHLPGADQLVIAATFISLIFMAVNTIFVYKNTLTDETLLSYLHEKHTPGIERFLLILLLPLTVYQFAGWIGGINDFFVPLVLVVTVYSAGLQFIALAWRKIGNESSHKNIPNLTLVVVSFIGMTLPMMAELLPFGFRLALVTIGLLSMGLLSVRLESARGISTYFTYAMPVVFILLAFSKMGWIAFGQNVVLNVALAIMMIVGMFLSPKAGIARTYFILSLTAYLLEVTTMIR